MIAAMDKTLFIVSGSPSPGTVVRIAPQGAGCGVREAA